MENRRIRSKRLRTEQVDINQEPNQSSSAALEDGNAKLWQQWCKRIDKANRSNKGEGSSAREHTDQEKQLLLELSPLREYAKTLTEIKKPQELSSSQKELQGKKKEELLGDDLSTTLKPWRKKTRLQNLEKMYKTLSNEKSKINEKIKNSNGNTSDEDSQKLDACNTLQKKVYELIGDILHNHPQSLQEYCSQLNKDTILGVLATNVRIPMLIEHEHLQQAFQSLETADTQPNIDEIPLKTFKDNLTDLKDAHEEKDIHKMVETYWKLKEQAESHLLEETESTLTQNTTLDIWTKLLTNAHPAEKTLNDQGWRSQGEGEDITNDLQFNRGRKTPRTEFLITPRMETFSRDESSKHPLRLKEIGDVLRSRIETELRKSLIPSIDKQLQENTNEIEKLNRLINSLEGETEESLVNMRNQYKEKHKNRKDATRHLKAAKYYAQTGEQPFGYNYAIVTRSYALENKPLFVLTRKIKEESQIDSSQQATDRETWSDTEQTRRTESVPSPPNQSSGDHYPQIYIFSEMASIADKFNVITGPLERMIAGHRNQVPEQEGDGVWERSLEKGAQELHPNTKTIKLLKDYRIAPSSNTIILHEEKNTLYLTNNQTVLSNEFGYNRSKLGSYLNPKYFSKQPNYLKFIYPHEYPENEVRQN